MPIGIRRAAAYNTHSIVPGLHSIGGAIVEIVGKAGGQNSVSLWTCGRGCNQRSDLIRTIEFYIIDTSEFLFVRA